MLCDGRVTIAFSATIIGDWIFHFSKESTLFLSMKSSGEEKKHKFEEKKIKQLIMKKLMVMKFTSVRWFPKNQEIRPN